MKNEKGDASVKVVVAITSVILAILVIVLIALIVKGIVGKNGKKAEPEPVQEETVYTNPMSFIEFKDNQYVFIDTDGEIVKLKGDSFDAITDLKEGDMVYDNSLLTHNDENASVVDFNGNVLYGPGKIEYLIKSKDVVLYQFEENEKYGVLNSKGEVIVPAKYSSKMTILSQKLDNYFYTIGEDNSGNKLYIFDKDGKIAYEGNSENNIMYNVVCEKTGTGMNIVVVRKNPTLLAAINLNTGEEIYTLTDNNDHDILVENKGMAVKIESYKSGMYGTEESDLKGSFLWFDENGKISRNIDLSVAQDLNQLNKFSDNVYSIYRDGTGKYVAVDKYGKEVYKSENELTQSQYVNKVTGDIHAYILEKSPEGYYKTINVEGNVIVNGYPQAVGNKYFLVGSTLYRHDGTKYMENVIEYTAIYNIDIIKTREKTTIENNNGDLIEEAYDYNLGSQVYLLNNQTVIFEGNKKLTIINMDDLSKKEPDFSSSEYVYIKKGYICTYNGLSGYEYYNTKGEKIYAK